MFLVVFFVKLWYAVERGSCGLGGYASFMMAEHDRNTNQENAVENRPAAKKPYQEPAFRYEKVFETMALSCGKVQSTQSGCHFNRHSS